jgi:hypothetical protein
MTNEDESSESGLGYWEEIHNRPFPVILPSKDIIYTRWVRLYYQPVVKARWEGAFLQVYLPKPHRPFRLDMRFWGCHLTVHPISKIHWIRSRPQCILGHEFDIPKVDAGEVQ